MVNDWLRLVRRFAWMLAAAFLCAVLLVFLHAHALLRALHPDLGVAFLAVVALSLAGLVAWVWLLSSRRPVVLSPPRRPDILSAPARDVRAYALYVRRLVQRLALHPSLPQGHAERLRDGLLMLDQAAGHWINRMHLDQTLARCEEDVLRPIFTGMQASADEAIRAGVRDAVSLAAFSPWTSWVGVSLALRLAGMSPRVAAVFFGAPSRRESVLLLRDAVRAAAPVDGFGYGRYLHRRLIEEAPHLGRFTEPVARAAAAGLVAAVVGRAIAGRCAAFRSWDPGQARRVALAAVPLDVDVTFEALASEALTSLFGAMGTTEVRPGPPMPEWPVLCDRVRSAMHKAAGDLGVLPASPPDAADPGREPAVGTY